MINQELIKLGIEVEPLEDQEPPKESKKNEPLQQPLLKQQANKSEYVIRLQNEIKGEQQFKLENRPVMTQSGKMVTRAKLIDQKKNLIR